MRYNAERLPLPGGTCGMIFISYASEDYDYACSLFLELKAADLAPWMDKPPAPHRGEGLQPGHRWRDIIEQKMRAADQIILVLSDRSVRKRGFVRYEFRVALELMNYIPDDEILVIPILKEQCEVPPLRVDMIVLTDLHWELVPTAELPSFVQRLAQTILGV